MTPRIESTADLKNFHHLRHEDQQLIQGLLDGTAPEPSSASAPAPALRAKIVKKIEGNSMTLTGCRDVEVE